MYDPQESKYNTTNVNNVLSPAAGFALDSSLDAELSLHNVASESWSNPNAGALFTNGNPYACLPHQQSGSPTSTTIATPTTEFDTSFTTGPTSQPSINSQTGIHAPTVVLRRPSMDTLERKLGYLPETAATPSPFSTPTANSTLSPSPLQQFGNLDLNFQQKGALTIDGPVCLLNGDTVEFVDHLLPVSPSGSSGGRSTPNSPLFELAATFDNLDNIPNTNQNVTNNNNNNNDYLQMSNWESGVSISPTSSSPSPIGLDLQPQKEQNWLPGTNQYQQQKQQQQNLTSFTDSLPSGLPFTPLNSFGGNVDQQPLEQQQQPTQRRSAHNAVEKKYRNNINDRITELKNAVPALRHARVKRGASASLDDNNHNEDDDSDEPVFMDGVAVATKLNKATILQKATEYVFHLQHTNSELKQDIDALLTTIAVHVPNGQELAQQYRQHVQQRDALQQQQLLHREKMKRHKKSGHAHYQYQHQHHQHQHSHHSPVKGENRSLNPQHPHFLYLQQQQQQ